MLRLNAEEKSEKMKIHENRKKCNFKNESK